MADFPLKHRDYVVKQIFQIPEADAKKFLDLQECQGLVDWMAYVTYFQSQYQCLSPFFSQKFMQKVVVCPLSSKEITLHEMCEEVHSKMTAEARKLFDSVNMVREACTEGLAVLRGMAQGGNTLLEEAAVESVLRFGELSRAMEALRVDDDDLKKIADHFVKTLHKEVGGDIQDLYSDRETTLKDLATASKNIDEWEGQLGPLRASFKNRLRELREEEDEAQRALLRERELWWNWDARQKAREQLDEVRVRVLKEKGKERTDVSQLEDDVAKAKRAVKTHKAAIDTFERKVLRECQTKGFSDCNIYSKFRDVAIKFGQCARVAQSDGTAAKSTRAAELETVRMLIKNITKARSIEEQVQQIDQLSSGIRTGKYGSRLEMVCKTGHISTVVANLQVAKQMSALALADDPTA